ALLTTAPAGTGTNLVFHPDGTMLAESGGDVGFQLWDLAEPSEPVLRRPVAETDGIRAAVFGADGNTLVTADVRGVLRHWEYTEQGGLRQAGVTDYAVSSSYIWAVALHPDGGLLATADDDAIIRLWDVSGGGDPIPVGAPLGEHEGPVTTVAFTPDGR